MLLVWGAHLPAFGATLTVPGMYPTVSAAVSAASSGDTVLIDPGVYPGKIQVQTSVTISGVGLVVLQADDPTDGVLLIDASGILVSVDGVTLTGGNTYPVIRMVDGDLILDNVDVQYGYDSDASGGAIRMESGADSLTINNSIVQQSTTAGSFNGGCIAVLGGDLTLNGVTMTTCSAGLNGGAIHAATSGDVVINDSTIVFSTAIGRGGAVHATSGDLTLDGVTMLQNSGGERGGGAVYLEGPDAEIDDSVFEGNSTTGNEGGGAVYLRNGVYDIRRSVFCSNYTSGTGNGGAFRLHAGTATIENSVFLFNGSGGDGGAVFVEGGAATLSHAALSGNTANGGDGDAAGAKGDLTVVDTYFGDNGQVGLLRLALDEESSGDVSTGTSAYWNNLGGDFTTPPVVDAGGNVLGLDSLIPPPGACDALLLVPPPLSPLLGAATNGDDIGPFDGPETWPDNDGDTVISLLDCDDDDIDAYPGAPELIADGVDQDCDGFESCFPDTDGDGFGEAGAPVSSSDLDCLDLGESANQTDLCPDFDDRTDTDADGTPDGCDTCPFDEDTDGDGLCDSVDPCPDDATNDTDGDGQCDSVDPCPDDPGDDSDGDTFCDGDDVCPGADDRVDSDLDGVADGCDLCPEGPDDADEDGDGIPDACDPNPETATTPTQSHRQGVGPDDTPAPAGCGCASSSAPAPLLAGLALALAARRRRHPLTGRP